tara:strand:+ start:1405 stop:2022 length:618 start_codon:yes stop_codon:yes gene_type:complete
MTDKIKLNLGCASRLLDGYLNVDMDSIEEIKKRYPNLVINENNPFLQCDVLNLPFEDSSVDEIRADAIIEHMSFLEEPKFFHEATRVLKPGGVLNISVPDFEHMVREWLNAEDDWKDFFRNDDEAIAQEHWFGQYSYSYKSRWGYITAGIFGPQNGEGQYHKNAYTQAKLTAIYNKLGYEYIDISRFYWKQNRPDLMIRIMGHKR